MSMIDPSIDDLYDKVGSKYALVIMASKRARQMVDHMLEDKAHGVEKPRYGAMVNETYVNTNKEENFRKPVSIALEEISKGFVTIADKNDKEK